MMSYIMIWAIGPMAHVPTKFHWDILKNERDMTISNYYYIDNNNNNNNSEDETTQKQDPIPLSGEWDNNSEDETTQKQDPIPLSGEWDNNNKEHSGSHSLHLVLARRQGIVMKM